MSAQPEEELDQFFTVFDGSSPEDVSHARQLWSSLSLLPLQESRLVSADIHQRLPVSRPQPSSNGPNPSAPQPPSVPAARQRQEERRRYLSMADQRREILALLRRQREQRIQKELLSVAFKPKMKISRGLKTQKTSDFETDKELVRQLH
ncbi:cilia- and flagella-associated protein HOATZ [Thunnus thynnus]|uniref:cilia- and flagella-associated protein HOATZ n=1 Tax=Thunnus thynnus TaxID=8237 RepID=UPI003527D8ED